MSGSVKNAVHFTLKDGDKDFIAAIYFPGVFSPCDFTVSTLKRCVSHVINGMDQILSSLPPGSRLTLEAKPSKSLEKGKKPSAKGRKKTRKRSRPIGKPSLNTSKGAAKKAKSSTSASGIK